MDLIPPQKRNSPVRARWCVLCLRRGGFHLLPSCTDSESWCWARAPDPLRSAFGNDKHTAACGEGRRHNGWPGLHQSQAKPTQIINPTAYMVNITKHVQNGELSPWKAGTGGGGGGRRKQFKGTGERVSGCGSFVKSCPRADLLPQSPLTANSS